MNKLQLPLSSKRSRTTAAQRQQFLAEFERSGLSGPDFARQHQIPYSTFCQWRKRHRRGLAVRFTEVQMVPPGPGGEPLVLEFGALARLRLSSPEQLELVARLLKHLQASC